MAESFSMTNLMDSWVLISLRLLNKTGVSFTANRDTKVLV